MVANAETQRVGSGRRRSSPGRLVGLCLLAVLAVVSAACSGPRTVALEDLAVEMDRYDGQEVVTHGVVAEFGGDDVDPYFVVQDERPNRVRLVPTHLAEPHAQSMVEVAGTFEYDPNSGRVIRIDRIEPVTADR